MDIIVIGGVAGGAAFATRMRRLDENANITVIEKTKYPSFANCALPYYVGGVVAEREELFAATKESLEARFKLKMLTETEAISIDKVAHTVTVKHLDEISTLHYDKLVLSPGSVPILPPFTRNVDGVYTLRTIDDVDAITYYIKQKNAQNVLIVGGGFIGLETSENLTNRGLKVTLVEAASQVMPSFDYEMANYIHNELRGHGVNLKLKTMLTDIKKTGDKLTASFDNGSTEDYDLIIVGIGVKPNSKLASDCGLTLTATGHIDTNEYMQTSDSDIYAIGDVVAVLSRITKKKTSLALAGPISKQVRAATGHIVGLSKPFEGVIGTSVVKLFSLEAASCGFNDASAKKAELQDAVSVWLHTSNHAGFYPGAVPVHFKLTFNLKTGLIYGAQAVATEGAAKAIEAVSTLIGKDGTVHDLAEREHAYAPPVSANRDVTCMAGAVAENACDGLYKIARFDELDTTFKDAFKLDVRGPLMFKEKHMEGFVNIPLDALRQNLDKIPKNKKIVVMCMVGQSAYLACRILKGNGFADVYDLSGSIQTLTIAGLI